MTDAPSSVERSCEHCGDVFLVGPAEQEFYARKGFVLPKRCPDCRWARTTGGARPERSELPEEPVYEVTCSACGAPDLVPFPPDPDRPAYCTACLRNR